MLRFFLGQNNLPIEVSFTAQECKWVSASCWGNLKKCRGLGNIRWTYFPSKSSCSILGHSMPRTLGRAPVTLLLSPSGWPFHECVELFVLVLLSAVTWHVKVSELLLLPRKSWLKNSIKTLRFVPTYAYMRLITLEGVFLFAFVLSFTSLKYFWWSQNCNLKVSSFSAIRFLTQCVECVVFIFTLLRNGYILKCFRFSSQHRYNQAKLNISDRASKVKSICMLMFL